MKEKSKNVIITLSNVKKSFENLKVLDGVNFSANRGETLVILGKSGTGKSVILKCIIGLIKPDEGKIEVFDEDISKLDDDELEEVRYRMGFLFQGGALYDSMTVKENLLFPLERLPKFKKMEDNELEGLLDRALESVGLLSAKDKMPSELSGGMQKRIALARTIILEPEIILYDEPTTGLDPVTSKEISDLILELQQKLHITSLVVTHDMQCAKAVANKILVLKEGKIFQEGTYDELEQSQDEFVKGFFELENK